MTTYKCIWTARIVSKAYSSILKNPDVEPLSTATRRRIKNYAREVFGSKWYYPWLYIYTAYRGRFIEGWVPDDFFGRVVLPRINADYRTIAGARSLARRLLQTDRFPDVAYYLHGSWFDVHGERIMPKQLKTIIFSDGPRAIVKLESSNQGKGIYFINEKTFDPANLPENNFVVQRFINQERWFEQVSPGCVATLRITTAIPNGGMPSIRTAYLRAGRSGARCVASAEALRIPIIDDDGTLGPFASDPNWLRHRKHPDTGFLFAAQKVPHFKDAVAVCEALHKRVPQFTIIGWDVAITEQGRIELMEFNTVHPDIKFSEAATGPCFRDLNLEQFA